MTNEVKEVKYRLTDKWDLTCAYNDRKLTKNACTLLVTFSEVKSEKIETIEAALRFRAGYVQRIKAKSPLTIHVSERSLKMSQDLLEADIDKIVEEALESGYLEKI